MTSGNNFIVDLVKATANVGAIVNAWQCQVRVKVKMVFFAMAFISFVNWNTLTSFTTVTAFAIINDTWVVGCVFNFGVSNVYVSAITEASEVVHEGIAFTVAALNIVAVVGACFLGVVVKVEIVIRTNTFVSTQGILTESSSTIRLLNSALIKRDIKNTSQ